MKKSGGLAHDFPITVQFPVGTMCDENVSGIFDDGAAESHLAVARRSKDTPVKGIARTITRNHAHFEAIVSQDAAKSGLIGYELLTGRSEEPFIGREVLQDVGQCAPMIGGADHNDPALLHRKSTFQHGTDDKPAHGETDEVNDLVWPCFAGQTIIHNFSQRLDRVRCRGIVHVNDTEAICIEITTHRSHRESGLKYPVEYDDYLFVHPVLHLDTLIDHSNETIFVDITDIGQYVQNVAAISKAGAWGACAPIDGKRDG